METRNRKLELLIVDDEPEFLKSVSTALRRRGMAVTTAKRGKDAFRLLRKKAFDVVTLDLKMPEMEGEVLLKKIHELWPNLPVIVITGHGSAEMMEALQEGNLFHYLPKPFDIDHLAEMIRQSIDEEWHKWYRKLRA